MKKDAFSHLAQLSGKILLANDSALRATDEVLAAWDAQARLQGLGPNWRWSDDALEASRGSVLKTLNGTEDLWIFAYGSLLWDPGFHFDEVRRATLEGHQRQFSYKTAIGRGTPDLPGLVLSVEPQAGRCQGLAFRIDASIADQESRLFWRREMIFGGYRPRLLPVLTPQGRVDDALVLVSNPDHPSHAGGMTLHETAAIIACARGSHGTNLDYLSKLVDQLRLLGIEDDYIERLTCLINREYRQELPICAPSSS